jgi:hypothetical protein
VPPEAVRPPAESRTGPPIKELETEPAKPPSGRRRSPWVANALTLVIDLAIVILILSLLHYL